MKERIVLDIELDKMDDYNADKNSYRELIVNNASKIENTLSPMEQWSILSNVINYVQYSENPKIIHAMKVKPINNSEISKGTKNGNLDESSLRVNLACTSDRSMEEYLDMKELNQKY